MPLQFPMTHDAMQSSLVFVQSQAARINAEVYRIQYRQVRYRGLVPVDTTGPEWLDSIVFYSIDGAGRAEWLNSGADDVPKVALQMGSTVAKVGLAGIGYDFTTEEVARAQALGIDLTNEKANVARRGAEQMIDRIVWSGDPQKGITGIRSTSLAMSCPVRPHSSDRQDGSVMTVGPASNVCPSRSHT